MTDRYAVIGNPIGHSKSPLIHTAFARATRQDIEYTRIEAPLDGFEPAVRAFRAHGGRGINVTTPFKLQACALATDPLDAARHAGAANALKFEGDRILAENFDGIGLVHDIERNLDFPVAGKRVLVLGAGGAARGALLPLLQRRPAGVTIANRHDERAVELAAHFGAHGAVVGCSNAALAHERFDLVINATSASMRGDLPDVPAGVFGPDALAYDLVYGWGLTPFLRLARDAGTRRLADGVGMLVEQAAEAFAWWRGVRPDTRAVIEQLAVPLQ